MRSTLAVCRANMLRRTLSRMGASNWQVLSLFCSLVKALPSSCIANAAYHSSLSPPLIFLKQYNLTRLLKQEKLRLTQKLTQKEAEAEKVKSKNIKREHEQILRLAKYREEKKEWGAETEQVKEELGEAKVIFERGRRNRIST